MFHLKPRTHIGWHASHPRTHTLTPRNWILDLTLVAAILGALVVGWRTLPPRSIPIANWIGISSESARPVLDRAPAPAPDLAQQDTNELIAMSRAPAAQTRVGAIAALGERGAIQALPRAQELQVVDGDANVQQAAYYAEDHLRAQIATALNLNVSEVKFLAATETGDAYTVTNANLYGLRDRAWSWISALPDTPNGIAVAPDGRTLYLATVSTGLWRSLDGGTTWKHVQFGLNTPTQLTVTAVIVNPEHAWQIFIALAGPGSAPQKSSPLGIFVSNDDGESWRYLPDSPSIALTTRLLFPDPGSRYLYGVADGTPWRYALPTEAL